MSDTGMRNRSFSSFELRNALLFDYSNSAYPTRVYGLVSAANRMLRAGSTHFIYVHDGKVWVDGEFPVKAGMYACVGRSFLSGSIDAKALIIERIGYNGMFSIGGPLEAEGRLKYIDGCTDSLLVPPVKKGDACLNHLHFPDFINQTMHTHPSIRIGMVASGRGECVTPFGNVPLTRGMVFVIHEDTGKFATGFDGEQYLIGSHCFRTFDEGMDVVAFHPDSDTGPTDEVHPMISRTIVDGVSASTLDDIRTK